MFWRKRMMALAECPNLMVKLSGLGTFDWACREERWRPIVQGTIDMFGSDRFMFGSNFPIEKLWTSYATLVGVMKACLTGYDAAEQREVLHDTAVRVYGPKKDAGHE